MGGLGKTTLAKKVYHHKDVHNHFHCFAWVCISQQYQTRDILQGIFIKLVPKRKKEVVRMRNKELFEQLYKVQQRKKCLVVLDDIWSIEAWKSLKPAFPNGITGSKTLLTTHNKTLPLQIDPYHILHEPQCLNDKESWVLLQKKSLLRRDGRGNINQSTLLWWCLGTKFPNFFLIFSTKRQKFCKIKKNTSKQNITSNPIIISLFLSQTSHLTTKKPNYLPKH
ncbi:hypothetical protein ACSBR2_041902 [Camellia fascicularis]